MAGRRFLVPPTGVRIPLPEPRLRPSAKTFPAARTPLRIQSRIQFEAREARPGEPGTGRRSPPRAPRRRGARRSTWCSWWCARRGGAPGGGRERAAGAYAAAPARAPAARLRALAHAAAAPRGALREAGGDDAAQHRGRASGGAARGARPLSRRAARRLAGRLRGDGPRGFVAASREPHQAVGEVRERRRAPRRVQRPPAVGQPRRGLRRGAGDLRRRGADVCSPTLPPDARARLGWSGALRLRRIEAAHRAYLAFHRANEFKGSNA